MLERGRKGDSSNEIAFWRLFAKIFTSTKLDKELVIQFSSLLFKTAESQGGIKFETTKYTIAL